MSDERVEFENERVRVSRVRVGAGSRHQPRSRKDRVIVWLTGAHHVRVGLDGRREELRRRPGEVAWRAASEHRIENIGEPHEVLIIELK
jgi:hypothetical protein